MNEQDRQEAKEKAVLIALQKCKALVRRDLGIYTMDKNGNTEMISKSDNYDDLWFDALKSLKND